MKLALGMLMLILALVAVSMLPVRHTDSPPFAHPAFQQAWSAQTASAALPLDVWGSDPLVWRVEPYAGAPSHRRTVQYFDRARMELEAGSGDVTIARLALELTTGQIDLGGGLTIDRQPPELSIDGGERHNDAPSYLTLSRIVGEPASDRSRNADEQVDEWINISGISAGELPPRTVRLVEYVDETGHNLPDVTAELFRQSQFADGRWIDTFGYPISEPYWTVYRRGDSPERSLVQVFERHVLVYSPDVTEERRFTVASTGRHYYQWRYQIDLTASQPDLMAGAPTTNVTVLEELTGLVYADGIGTPIDLALAPSGHLLILTAEGRILRSTKADPDAYSEEFDVWADDIETPERMVAANGYIYVVAGDDMLMFRDRNGSGVRLYPSGEADLAPAPGAFPELDAAGTTYAVDRGADGTLRVTTARHTYSLNETIAELGPVFISRGTVVAAGVDEGGTPRIVQSESERDDGNQADSPTPVVTLPPDARIQALVGDPDPAWGIAALGSHFIAVEQAGAGRVYGLSLDQPSGATELRELATGFRRPVAMQLGLDGSLYVADADLGRVVRIVAGHRP